MSFVVEHTTPGGHKISCKDDHALWTRWIIYAYKSCPTLSLVNTGLFINNEFVAGANTIDTINPATGKVITAVQAGTCYYAVAIWHFLLICKSP